MSSANGPGRRVLAVRGRHRPRRRGGGRHATRCAAPGRCSSATTTGRTRPSDVAVDQDLTFTNDGDQDVTLDLALTGDQRRRSPWARPRSPCRPAARRPCTVTGDPQAVDLGRHVGCVVGTDAATGDPVTRTSWACSRRTSATTWTSRWSTATANRPPAGSPSTWPATRWGLGRVRRGCETLRLPPGNYSVTAYLDVHGEAAGPVRPRRAGRPRDRAGPRRRGRARRPARAPARRPRRRSAPRTGSARSTSSITTDNGLEFRSAYAVPPMVDDIYVSPTEADDHGSFMLTTRWRKGEPMLGLGTPGGAVGFDDPRAAGQRARHRDRHRATVYAGNGAAADYAGPRRPRQDRGRRPQRRGRAAGARRGGRRGRRGALVVVNDGVGGLNEYVGDVADPGRRPSTATPGRPWSRWRKSGAKLTADPARVHAVRLRPDPRVPGPGAGPAAGLPAAARATSPGSTRATTRSGPATPPATGTTSP